MMELSKKDSKMLQGLAVLAMVWLHLFDKESGDLFIPLIFVGSKPLSFLVAQLSDFCVFGFAFVSGYGHMAQSDSQGWYRRRLKGLLSVFVNYWVILAAFSIVSVIVGKASFMPGSVTEFLMNALTLENTFNGAWWYMFAYAVIVLASPVILKAVRKWHPAILIILSCALYVAAYAVRFWIPNGGNWLLIKIGPLGMTVVEYVIGAFFFRFSIFTTIYNVWNKINRWLRLFVSVVLIAGLLVIRTYVIPALFFAPVSGIIIMTLFHFWRKPDWVCNSFAFIGNHSTNIWLTHMFFYSEIFVGLVYKAKYIVPVYVFVLGITVCVSVILMYAEKPIQRFILKKD